MLLKILEVYARPDFPEKLRQHVLLSLAALLVALWVLRSRAALLVLAVVVLQAAIGIVQYHLGLPIVLVLLHLLGASLAVAASTNLFLTVRSASFSAGGPARSRA